tara:strand:- start:1133 stop:1435 length:303 start_codon:yes stop_codon:yes gene_type:complete
MNSLNFMEPKWGIYLIVCFVCAILLHSYSQQVYHFRSEPLTWFVLFVPSALSAFYVGEWDRALNKNPIMSFLSRMAPIIMTVWPTWIVLEICLFIVSLFL